LESAALLLEDFEIQKQALARLASSIEAARDIALATAESVGDHGISRDAFTALEQFDRRR
jgi:hypothetical protein